jgi:hypothetical protein
MSGDGDDSIIFHGSTDACVACRPDKSETGYTQDGERWWCPACGRCWVHYCDEAEGCGWDRQPREDKHPPTASRPSRTPPA